MKYRFQTLCILERVEIALKTDWYQSKFISFFFLFFNCILRWNFEWISKKAYLKRIKNIFYKEKRKLNLREANEKLCSHPRLISSILNAIQTTHFIHLSNNVKFIEVIRYVRSTLLCRSMVNGRVVFLSAIHNSVLVGTRDISIEYWKT